MTAQRGLRSLLKTPRSPALDAGVLGEKVQNSSVTEKNGLWVAEGEPGEWARGDGKWPCPHGPKPGALLPANKQFREILLSRELLYPLPPPRRGLLRSPARRALPRTALFRARSLGSSYLSLTM